MNRESGSTADRQAEAHDRWFCAQVQASLNDADECIPHDQVMADMDRLIAETEARLFNKPA